MANWFARLIYGKKSVPIKEHRRIVMTLRSQIRRMKDELNRLKEERIILLNSSIKQANRTKELKEILEKIKKEQP